MGTTAFAFPWLARVITALSMMLVVSACQTVEVESLVPLSEKYAAIVVDVDTGKILHKQNAESLRYPASLTKMMTLYMLFEAMESGKVSSQTPIPVSAYARTRPPSKIGFRAGQSIDTDNAIRALIIKSGNDVATAVAEYLSGSESAFASAMTQKARSLGMSRTQFRNASGLPDSSQYTTAMDMARLSLVLRKRFPQYYPRFSERSFTYRGRQIRGHNRLLADPGVDGIKTGYIRASGFNVATSVRRGGRAYIVVVMGGKSASARDQRVRELIARYARAPSGTSRSF